MPRPAALLAPPAHKLCARPAQSRDRARLLGLLAEHPLAEIANLGPGGLQFALQSVLALLGQHECNPMALVGQFKAPKSPRVQRLVLLVLTDKINMLALGQCDPLKVERLC